MHEHYCRNCRETDCNSYSCQAKKRNPGGVDYGRCSACHGRLHDDPVCKDEKCPLSGSKKTSEKRIILTPEEKKVKEEKISVVDQKIVEIKKEKQEPKEQEKKKLSQLELKEAEKKKREELLEEQKKAELARANPNDPIEKKVIEKTYERKKDVLEAEISESKKVLQKEMELIKLRIEEIDKKLEQQRKQLEELGVRIARLEKESCRQCNKNTLSINKVICFDCCLANLLSELRTFVKETSSEFVQVIWEEESKPIWVRNIREAKEEDQMLGERLENNFIQTVENELYLDRKKDEIPENKSGNKVLYWGLGIGGVILVLFVGYFLGKARRDRMRGTKYYK